MLVKVLVQLADRTLMMALRQKGLRTSATMNGLAVYLPKAEHSLTLVCRIPEELRCHNPRYVIEAHERFSNTYPEVATIVCGLDGQRLRPFYRAAKEQTLQAKFNEYIGVIAVSARYDEDPHLSDVRIKEFRLFSEGDRLVLDQLPLWSGRLIGMPSALGYLAEAVDIALRKSAGYKDRISCWYASEW